MSNGVSLSDFASLLNRVLVTFLIIVLYRAGTYVPLPFIDAKSYLDILGSGSGSGEGGLLGVVNALSGGALSRYSLFSLNVMPYIVASIISQLFFASFVTGKKSDTSQSAKIAKLNRWLTVVFAFAQGTMLSISMSHADVTLAYMSSVEGFMHHLVVVLSLVAGTSLLVWMGELITSYGVGNGVSVIIFTGIVSELPRAIYSTLELGRVGAYSNIFVAAIFTTFLLLTAFVVFMERSTRNVLVYYPKRQAGGKVYSQQISHIPIKLNVAGVIPAIFANTLMLAPASIAGLESLNFLGKFMNSFYSGSIAYYCVYFVLIVFFAFFYTSVVFNPSDIADNLRKGGGVVSGMRPGSNTSEYLRLVVMRLTCLGSLYIAFVCVVVDVARAKYSIPFALGGTSVLIVVGVINEVVSQAGLHVLSRKYDAAISRISLKEASL